MIIRDELARIINVCVRMCDCVIRKKEAWLLKMLLCEHGHARAMAERRMQENIAKHV